MASEVNVRVQAATQAGKKDSVWRQMIEGIPSTVDEVSTAIKDILMSTGYLHITWPMSMEHYELIANRLGTVILRSDVKVDLERERKQEEQRTVKGRGGIYSPTPLGWHTDPHADLVSWYCVEQDDIGGPMLMLQVSDLEQCFTPGELDIMSKVELVSPGRDQATGRETLTAVPLLAKRDRKYRVFYASWLLRDSYDSLCRSVLQKFTDYVKHKEQTQLITLPVKKHDTVFIDNGRMLHGRGALSATSKRHLVRLYLRAA
ncbi:MAG TPA: TauD/TfdA family dioxygenase [Candidatus Angelobacter sp.]|jgi:hypothetical protein|nr:TauD/TfdA family dioxygenase [Candidatus Angelobacter sp.]